MFEDIDGTLRLIHQLCAPSTRIVISYYSHLWEPVLKLAEALRSAQQAAENQLHRDRRLPQPDGSCRFRGDQRRAAATAAAALLGLGPSSTASSRRCRASGSCACAPIIVGRPVKPFPDRKLSASILIPCRNERGNIENAIRRMPRFGIARRKSCSSRAIPATAPSRNASASATPTRIMGHQGAEAGRQGQGRCGPQGLCRCDRRRADDPRRRPDHAAGGAAEISRGDRERQGRVRQRHAAGLPDGKRGDAPAQSSSPTAALPICSAISSTPA